ncbi:MAG: SCP2 sterol-binding domain-containing protein [Eubacterium sp.]|nr:SCP2 sterol-binding domain-containing protein [Eubacterium sp.]
MKINIYYGGRGVLDDPTLYVIDKMQKVLEELRVTVDRYNLYEQKNNITTLPQTIKEADGIILATTVEWLGIGGYMQQFLDCCWLYGDKEKISKTYMQPVVMSTTYGEREGEISLASAWEILGGLPCGGLCGYVADLLTFEMNRDYSLIIEKKAENLYRTISQKMKSLPTSNQVVTKTVLRTKDLGLTPQESEQLSKYVSDDTYVKKQKEDIEELANKFKGLLDRDKVEEVEESLPYIADFESSFNPHQEFKAKYLFIIEGIKKPLIIEVEPAHLQCSYGKQDGVDVYAKMTPDVLERIIAGKMTFQRAFMTGELTAKGNFKTLRMLDDIFNFG